MAPRHTSQGEPILDVAIIGGGHTGLAVAWGLMRNKVSNILILDENPSGYEGPWLRYARMETLRTPKHFCGPDGGIPALTFRAWYGEERWQSLHLISRLDWAAYLQWFKHTLQIPIQNEVKIQDIEWFPEEQCFLLNKSIHTRKLVLATGMEGNGEWLVPLYIKRNIPRDKYFIASDPINFPNFAGKSIGILGASASAFDHAIQCAEAGADVHIYIRRSKLVEVDTDEITDHVGFLAHYQDLPDEQKWKWMAALSDISQGPPPHTIEKAKSYSNIHYHYSAPWTGSRFENKPIILTPHGEKEHDYLIIAAGWKIDLVMRPELKNLIPHIALWRDRYQADDCPGFLRVPYLTKNLQFTEKHPGEAPYLLSIFDCTGGAVLSTGFNNSISSMRYHAERVVHEITGQLFIEESPRYLNMLLEMQHDG